MGKIGLLGCEEADSAFSLSEIFDWLFLFNAGDSWNNSGDRLDCGKSWSLLTVPHRVLIQSPCPSKHHSTFVQTEK